MREKEREVDIIRVPTFRIFRPQQFSASNDSQISRGESDDEREGETKRE